MNEFQTFDTHELEWRFNQLKFKIIKENSTEEEWDINHMTWCQLTMYINEVIQKYIDTK